MGNKSRSLANAFRRRCEGFAKPSQILSTSPQPLSCEGSCHAFLLPAPHRWATEPLLPTALLRGSCHAFLLPAPHRWATRAVPLRTPFEGAAKALRNPHKSSLHLPNRSPAKVAAMPSCCQRLTDGQQSHSSQPLSCEVAAMPSCCQRLTDGQQEPFPCERLSKALRRLCETLTNPLYISPTALLRR